LPRCRGGKKCPLQHAGHLIVPGSRDHVL
jgi:hypothetical protein